jgi:hypothetical protein
LTNLAEFLLPGTGENAGSNGVPHNDAAPTRWNIQSAAHIMNEMNREAERILSRTRRLVAVA